MLKYDTNSHFLSKENFAIKFPQFREFSLQFRETWRSRPISGHSRKFRETWQVCNRLRDVLSMLMFPGFPRTYRLDSDTKRDVRLKGCNAYHRQPDEGSSRWAIHWLERRHVLGRHRRRCSNDGCHGDYQMVHLWQLSPGLMEMVSQVGL